MLELKDLQDRFGAHTTWYCYRNIKSHKTFARHKPLAKPGPDIEALVVVRGTCHMESLRFAKTKTHIKEIPF